MSTQPFSVSTEAVAWIVENLGKGVEKLKKELGASANLAPILSFAYSYQVLERGCHLVERYDADHFRLGWDYTEGMDPGGFLQIEIGGFKVFVHHGTLERLEGKELVLETVEVGYPIPASRKCQLLKARPKGGKERGRI